MHWSTKAPIRRGSFANVVDDPKRSSFIMPSIIDRSPLMVAISSGSRPGVLARLLREKLEALLPQHLGAVATFAATCGEQVRPASPAWASGAASGNGCSGRIGSGRRWHGISASANQLADSLFADEKPDRWRNGAGGCWPRRSGSATLHALRQMQQADVVVYDRLVSDEVMALVRRDASIFVGKQTAGNHCVPQEDQPAVAGGGQKGRVVRLKGDLYLRPWRRGAGDAGRQRHRFSGGAGITAASGCAAYAGIPADPPRSRPERAFRHRPRQKGRSGSRLAAAGQIGKRLVFYRGSPPAPPSAEQLLAHGKGRQHPVALIEAGTQPNQRVIRGTLDQLPALAVGVESPPSSWWDLW